MVSSGAGSGDFHISSAPRAGTKRGTSAHVELTGELAALIHSGQLRPGTRFPPERELCKQLGVGRTTLRLVLDGLAQRNLITREVGRGTFVAAPKFEHRLDLPGVLGAEAPDDVTYRLVQMQTSLPDGTMADLLMLPSDDVVEVTTVVRVRLQGGRTRSVETVHLALVVDPEMVAMPLAELLRAAGVVPALTRQRLEPVLAGAWEANLLGTAEGATLMLLTRRTWDVTGRVVEFSQEYHRADANSFVVEVQARELAGADETPSTS